jgi:hypothetical protein
MVVNIDAFPLPDLYHYQTGDAAAAEKQVDADTTITTTGGASSDTADKALTSPEESSEGTPRTNSKDDASSENNGVE